MKKKTAFALSVAALIGAGVTFGVKNKQEKDDYEKLLKEILIPDAEEKLNHLLSINSALNDSIITYEQALRQISSQHDSITATRTSFSDFSKIYNLMSDINKEWSRPMDEALRKLDWERNDEYDYGWDNPEIKGTKQEIETFSMIYHRTGDLSKYYPHIANYPELNGIKTKFMLKNEISIPTLKEIEYRGDGKPTRADVETIDTELTSTNRIDEFAATIQNAIESLSKHTYIKSYYNYEYGNEGWVEVYTPKNEHPGRQLAILKSLQSFLDAIDKSDKVFKPETLKALQAEIDKLLPTVEKEYKKVTTSEKKVTTSEKLDKFKTAKGRTQKLIEQQKAEVKHLKTSDISKLLNKQKKQK